MALNHRLKKIAGEIAKASVPRSTQALLNVVERIPIGGGSTTSMAVGASITGAIMVVHHESFIASAKLLAEDAGYRQPEVISMARAKDLLGRHKPVVIDHHVVSMAMMEAHHRLVEACDVAKAALELNEEARQLRIDNDALVRKAVRQGITIDALRERVKDFEEVTKELTNRVDELTPEDDE